MTACTLKARLLVLLTAFSFLVAAPLALVGCASDSASSEDIAELPAEPPYPSVPENPELADFSKSAIDFVAGLGAGWNLGNTLDATGAFDLTSETSWGLPKTTAKMMTDLKASGITTVRIPVSWHNHVDSAFTIDEAWMARVKEVVEYALDADLYVIINIHHDNDAEFYYPDSPHKARSLEYARRVWKQVALQFRNYDEHLVFELLNEPRLVGYANEWGWSDADANHVASARVIGELEQVALGEIRDSGSNNANRYVMVTPYVAAPGAALSSHFAIPTDTATDKLILSVHAYAPYAFAMQDPGVSAFTSAHKTEIDSFMGQLNAKFVVGKEMPVIIGEYGATNKKNLSDRVAWFTYYVGKASSYGMATIVWDNGNSQVPASGKFSELYGFFNRTAGTWYEEEIQNAIIDAAK
jgi:endoglucanase